MDDKQQDLTLQASSSSDYLGGDIWKREPAPDAAPPAAAPSPEPPAPVPAPEPPPAAPIPEAPAAAPAPQEAGAAVQKSEPAAQQGSGVQDAGAAGPGAGAPPPSADHAAVPRPAAPAAAAPEPAAAPNAAVPEPAPAAAAAPTAAATAPAPAAAPTAAEPAGAPPSALVEKQVLTVGRGIRLVAKVCECESLTVEGHLEAAAYANSLVVAEGGCFMGSAEVKAAEINGTVEGNLTVTERLTIRPTGKVSGTTRYQEIVIDGGGEIHGNAQRLSTAAEGSTAAPAPRDAMAG